MPAEISSVPALTVMPPENESVDESRRIPAPDFVTFCKLASVDPMMAVPDETEITGDVAARLKIPFVTIQLLVCVAKIIAPISIDGKLLFTVRSAVIAFVKYAMLFDPMAMRLPIQLLANPQSPLASTAHDPEPTMNATPVPEHKIAFVPYGASDITPIGPPYGCKATGEKLTVTLLALPAETMPVHAPPKPSGKEMFVTVSGAFPEFVIVSEPAASIPVTTLPNASDPERPIDDAATTPVPEQIIVLVPVVASDKTEIRPP